MLHTMLAVIIRETFLKDVGKFQADGTTTPKAMHLRFSVPCYPGEEGYRHRELLIYGPASYVAVFERETWDVIPEEHLEYDEGSDECRIKKGCSYVKGASLWLKKAYHDSCWSDAIENFFREHKNTLNGFSGPSWSWYKVVNPKDFTLPDGF